MDAKAFEQEPEVEIHFEPEFIERDSFNEISGFQFFFPQRFKLIYSLA